MSTLTQGRTGPWDCICGYPGRDRADLDEHLIATMHGGDPEGTHRPANRARS